MKKISKILWVGLISYFAFLSLVEASTNTRERTEKDYLVPSHIEVTEQNKQNILSTPSVDTSEKIYDFANLLTDSEEKELYQKITSYIDSYGMDFALVTINENKKTWVQYADDFYDYNDFKTSGVLLLIDMDNRQLHMSTSGEAIKMYNDARIDHALDSVYKYMKEKKYYKGVQSYLEIISNQADQGYPSSNNQNQSPSLLVSMIISFFASATITLIVMLILIGKNRLAKKATTAKEYLVEDTVKINNIGEIFLGTHTVRHKIEHNSSSGGGSSTHSGSSGVSHGGGSHRF